MSVQRMELDSPEQCTEQQQLSMAQASKEKEKNPLLLIAKHPKANKKGGWRLTASRLFLTFPQTDTTKEVALQRLQSCKELEIKGYLIAQEKHKGETS